MEGWVKRHVVVELRMVKYKLDHCTHHLHPPAVPRTPYTIRMFLFHALPPYPLVFAKIRWLGTRQLTWGIQKDSFVEREVPRAANYERTGITNRAVIPPSKTPGSLVQLTC